MGKPILIRLKPNVLYNVNDPDGLMYMIDHDFGGCTVMVFTEPMDMDRVGKVTIDGKNAKFVFKKNKEFSNIFHTDEIAFLGVNLWGILTEYNQTVTVNVEGFYSKNGEEMLPAEFTIRSVSEFLPLPEYSTNDSVALKIAEEGIVLLKNNGVLPLAPNSILNIFGKGFKDFRTSAVGAGKINPRYTVDFKKAILNDSGFILNEELDKFYRSGLDLIPSQDVIFRAKENGDVGIVVISRASGENYDNMAVKGEFYLTDEEESLIKIVAESFKKSIVILNVGYPIDVRFIEKYGVKCVVYCGYGGMLGGSALAHILDGRATPSGRLPDTWARDLSDIPSDKNFYKNTLNDRVSGSSKLWFDTVYEEDIYVGYRYFSTFNVQPAYPFGWGLSYTEFSLTPYKFDFGNNGISFSVSVKNVGQRFGKEVVQAYLSKPDGVVEKPRIELIGFEKTKELQIGESQTVNFKIDKRYLTSYDEGASAYVLEKGEYVLYVGRSSVELIEVQRFTLEKTETVKQVKTRMRPKTRINRLSKFVGNSFPTGVFSGCKGYDMPFEKSLKKPFVKEFEKEFDERIARLTVERLARLTVCSSSEWGMENVGGAGEIFPVEGLDIPKFVVADGNSGANIPKRNVGMPSGATMSASFNKELIFEVGRIIGEEAKENGISLILAPGMNIHRHPLCGRQPEYFSEDPLLAGMMGGYYCKGLESTGVGGCYKHCIANNAETARIRNQSVISERVIREIYFKAFEIALDVHKPCSIMTSYNFVNACPTSANSDLLMGMFREECGFDGFIMTDWGTYESVDVVDMINGGNNWITPGSNDNTFVTPIINAVNEGRLSLDKLRESVGFLLKTVWEISNNLTKNG